MDACSNGTVHTGNCSHVLVYIGGDTRHLHIAAPDGGGGGALTVNVSDVVFSENRIDAADMAGAVQLSCLGASARCQVNRLSCPRHGCDILCEGCAAHKAEANASWDCTADCIAETSPSSTRSASSTGSPVSFVYVASGEIDFVQSK